ncbi:MAG TPA: sigma-70 family RNA polymerase sigma factor [Ferruginibacter sp.]|nr:sigma-70 family RNA polymerase sigma factor [Ferruginibacter sp.]HMP21568.1 sigma-70 family RNA polymerase sigma factor [Ferruginibacter sp.]
MNSEKFKHTDDNQLLQLFYAEKNNELLGILLQRYTMLLLGVCMKYLKNEEEARDAVQQVFLKAITELHKYEVQYFKSWLYMVAKNHCLMKLRDKGRILVNIGDNPVVAPDDLKDIQQSKAKDKALSQLEAALQQLNTDQRQCVTLFYLQKKSYQDVARLTGYTLMQVKSHIQNGKRNLKIMLERSPDYEQ